MKFVKFLVLFLVILLLAGCGPVRCDAGSGDECQRVLFVGNSYTYVNDLPRTFSELARSGGHKVEVGTLAEGGFLPTGSCPIFQARRRIDLQCMGLRHLAGTEPNSRRGIFAGEFHVPRRADSGPADSVEQRPAAFLRNLGAPIRVSRQWNANVRVHAV